MKKIILILFTMVFCCTSLSYALDPTTHEAINVHVGKSTTGAFSLGAYLFDELEFQGREDEDLGTGTVLEHLENGGLYEDLPPGGIWYVRSLNHFHNPLTEEGFKGDCRLSLCVSSTVWALKPKGTQSNSGMGNYSWHDVRSYYLTALTSVEKVARGLFFEHTFRGLGQLMHLVQDASVPAHTRDDFHFLVNYEKTAKKEIISDMSSIHFSGSFLSVTSLIDTNQYNGINPEVTSSNSIGLSEYTNANFFSNDTIYTGKFPYPSITTSTPTATRVYTNPDTNVPLARKYYLNSPKKCLDENNTERDCLLAAIDYTDYYMEMSPIPYYEMDEIIILDENVYRDYAFLLLPRAIGYSSDLLGYFFRGKINMVKDPDNSGKFLIENHTDENMNGTFSLYYDNNAGQRLPVKDENNTGDAVWNTSIAGKVGDVAGKSGPVDFTEPPDVKEEGKYILVMNGTLGTEAGAVAAKVVKLDTSPIKSFYITIGENNYTYGDTYTTHHGPVRYYAKTYPNVAFRLQVETEEYWADTNELPPDDAPQYTPPGEPIVTIPEEFRGLYCNIAVYYSMGFCQGYLSMDLSTSNETRAYADRDVHYYIRDHEISQSTTQILDANRVLYAYGPWSAGDPNSNGQYRIHRKKYFKQWYNYKSENMKRWNIYDPTSTKMHQINVFVYLTADNSLAINSIALVGKSSGDVILVSSRINPVRGTEYPDMVGESTTQYRRWLPSVEVDTGLYSGPDYTEGDPNTMKLRIRMDSRSYSFTSTEDYMLVINGDMEVDLTVSPENRATGPYGYFGATDNGLGSFGTYFWPY